MSSIQYHVSTTMLDWIARSQSLDIQGLAEQVAPRKQDNFVKGIITQTQANALTHLANIPFGFLFLDTPPSEDFGKPNLPDLRTLPKRAPLSDNFYAVLNDSIQKTGMV